MSSFRASLRRESGQAEVEFSKVKDSRKFTNASRRLGCRAACSVSCQIRSLGMNGALNLPGSFKVGWRF